MTTISDAAKQGKSQVVIAAIERGETVDLQRLLRKVYQDFHTIQKHSGHLQLAEYLLAAGAVPEREMVCEAARGGHAALIHCLLQNGLDNDLFVAAALGNATEVQRHLRRWPDSFSDQDSWGMTPLHYCCASRVWRDSPTICSSLAATSLLLLDAGADIHAAGDYYGLSDVTPLFYVAWTGGLVPIASQLLERGAEITQHVFFAAVGHFQRHGDGNYDVAKALLDRGFDINFNQDRTALHALAAHEDARGVAWLLDHGADMNARDSMEETPLIAAARRNAGTKVLQQLIAAGADITAVNQAGMNALKAAESAGRTKAVALLQRAVQARGADA